MSRHSTRPARRSFHRSRQIAARRRSSGAWAVVATSPRPPHVTERTTHEVYVDECAATRDHLRNARAGQAAEAARRALGALPRGLDAQRLLGLALLELGEARAAAHAFSAALTADPLDIVAHVGLAESQELLEGVSTAEAAWQRAWEVEPNATSGGANRVPGVAERLQAARRAAGALDVRDGPPPLTRAALARIHLRGRLYEHAAIEARAVLAKDPDRADVRLTLAEAFWRAGESELAAAVAGEIRERLPDCVAANLLVATHWLTEGRDASELMARVQAVDPAGTIAQTLFDDREVPALFGTDALPEPTATAAPGVPAPALEPEPVREVEPQREPEPEPEPEPEAERVEPAESELAETQPLADVEAPQAEPAPEEDVPEPSRAAVPEPTPEPALVTAVVPSRETDDRTAGNAAMAAGHYLDAARLYGAWLRSLRPGVTD